MANDVKPRKMLNISIHRYKKYFDSASFINTSSFASVPPILSTPGQLFSGQQISSIAGLTDLYPALGNILRH